MQSIKCNFSFTSLLHKKPAKYMAILITPTINPEFTFVSGLHQSLEHLTDINIYCWLFWPPVVSRDCKCLFLWAWGRGGGGRRGGGRWRFSPCRLRSAPPALCAAPGFQRWLPPGGLWPSPDCSPEGHVPPAVSPAKPTDPRSAPSSPDCSSAGSLDGGRGTDWERVTCFSRFGFCCCSHKALEHLRDPSKNHFKLYGRLRGGQQYTGTDRMTRKTQMKANKVLMSAVATYLTSKTQT